MTAPDELRPVAEALVVEMGGEPVWVPESARPLYHAALSHGANHLVTLVNDAVRPAGRRRCRGPGPAARAAAVGRAGQRAAARRRRADRARSSRGDVATVAAPPAGARARTGARCRPTWPWPAAPPSARTPPAGSTDARSQPCSTTLRRTPPAVTSTRGVARQRVRARCWTSTSRGWTRADLRLGELGGRVGAGADDGRAARRACARCWRAARR